MVFEGGIPLFENDLSGWGQLNLLSSPNLQRSYSHLLWSSSDLSCDELLEVADGVVWITLHANLLSETVVTARKEYQYNTDNK